MQMTTVGPFFRWLKGSGPLREEKGWSGGQSFPTCLEHRRGGDANPQTRNKKEVDVTFQALRIYQKPGPSCARSSQVDGIIWLRTFNFSRERSPFKPIRMGKRVKLTQGGS